MSEEQNLLQVLQRRKPASDATGSGYLADELAKATRAYQEVSAAMTAMRASHDRERERMDATIAEKEATIAALRERTSAAEKECAEWKGKCSILQGGGEEGEYDYEAEEAGYTSRIDALNAELTAVKVEHAACAPKIAAATALADMLKADKAALTTRLQTLETALASEDESESEDEGPTGCEIDVMRGGDDRIRSLRVRYTKE